MSKLRKAYDYRGAEKLAQYVVTKYRNQLSNGAMQFYLLALPTLEKKRCGLCGPITASYRELAAAGFRTAPKLKPILQELAGILCEIEIGESLKGTKRATTIRRYSLRELQSKELQGRLVVTTPECANRLASKLNKRAFRYGSAECSPSWKVTITGRVQSYEPNVQGHHKQKRLDNLRAGLTDDRILFAIDFKQAEPTVIQQLLDYTFPDAPYEALAAIQGISRNDAKKKVNMLAYANSAMKILRHWHPDAQEFFGEYAQKVDEYKEKLWRAGKPRGKRRRFVHTVGGTRIEAGRGDEVHRGTVLNWQIQGTIADIVNAACLEVLKREASEGWTLVFPVHDSVYVIGRPEHRSVLEGIMQRHADRLNLRLDVKTQELTRC
jgi:hypothetical protein